LCPVQDEERNHWIAACADLKKRQIEVMDSLVLDSEAEEFVGM
jgi:hypothetical protein